MVHLTIIDIIKNRTAKETYNIQFPKSKFTLNHNETRAFVPFSPLTSKLLFFDNQCKKTANTVLYIGRAMF